MPTYDYKCNACGHAFEKFQSITASPLKTCPECGKNKVKRLIGTGAGLIFKGSGFYITDYRDKSYTDKAKADTGGSSSSGGESKSGESKSGENKSEAKAEAKKTDAPAKTESKPTKSEPKSKPKSKD